MPTNLTEDYLYATKHYYKVMEKYRSFFNSIFQLPLVTFGYIRYLDNGEVVCLDSSPQLIELFCDMRGIEDDPAHTKHDKARSGSVFLYSNYNTDNIKHNAFRIEAEKQLNIKQSFLVTEKYSNYYQLIPFGFASPSKEISIPEHQNIILRDCLSHSSEIKACFDQFKQEIIPVIEKKDLYRVNLKELKKDKYETQNNIINTRKKTIKQALLNTGIIENGDLMLHNIRFTKQEKKVLDLYLQGLSAKETAKTINRSPRTIEEHLNTIKIKLRVKKKSEIFEKIRKMKLLGFY